MYKKNPYVGNLGLFPMHLIKRNSPWITLSNIIPWDEIEDLFLDIFSTLGREALSIRVILGSLIIQTKMGLTDRDTIEQIGMNPALQYFLGLDDFDPEYSFDFTLLCKYRKLLGLDLVDSITTMILKHNKINIDDIKESSTNKGSISIDASVIPVNITYPTDIKLLNTTREKTEELIDILHKESSKAVKPRTYRVNARIDYLKYAKRKKLKINERRSGVRIQLQYIKRNINTITTYLKEGKYQLNDKQDKVFNTIKNIYDQHYTMWETNTSRVEHRIVSFNQNHIRGIVRGKTGTNIEFGPKVSMYKKDGLIYVDKLDFNNFNEGSLLVDSISRYKDKYGCYPSVIRADKIYQTNVNKLYCKARNIRLSGYPLGKKRLNEEDKTIIKEDFKTRIEIEGVFGAIKTKYGLSNLLTKLPSTQIASIALVILVFNLTKIARALFSFSNYEMHIFSIFESEVEHEMVKEDMYFI